MKVAIDVLSQSPGHSTGALSWFLQFARAAPARDPTTDYVLIAGRGDADYYRRKNPATRVIGAGWGNARRWLRVLSEHLLLSSVLKREKTDILFHGGSGVAPLRLPRRLKLVLAIWGMQHVASSDIRWEQKLYRSLFFKPGLRRADLILVNSGYTRDLLLAHYDDIRAPVEVVHHGVDLELFRPGPLTAQDRDRLARRGAAQPYVLFVGQIYPYKKLDILADAFCRAILRAGLPHRLVVVGSFGRADSMGASYRRKIEAVMAAAGLQDRLVLMEDVNIQELRALYAGAALYVQPSASETFGRTVIEAMACGAPVLAARAAATPEILGDAGLYYETEDAQSCAAQMLAVLQDEALHRGLVAKGLVRAQDFSYDGEVAQLVAIFHRVAG
jgi:glycosyltransferase involved in cell wall biosynthesis